MQIALKSQIADMQKDIDAKDKKVSPDILQKINWGLGFGLQKNENGEVIMAFRCGTLT